MSQDMEALKTHYDDDDDESSPGTTWRYHQHRNAPSGPTRVGEVRLGSAGSVWGVREWGGLGGERSVANSCRVWRRPVQVVSRSTDL